MEIFFFFLNHQHRRAKHQALSCNKPQIAPKIPWGQQLESRSASQAELSEGRRAEAASSQALQGCASGRCAAGHPRPVPSRVPRIRRWVGGGACQDEGSLIKVKELFPSADSLEAVG